MGTSPKCVKDMFADVFCINLSSTSKLTPHHTITVLWLFRDHPGEPVDFMVQGEINRGRHTDHPAGRHSIRTN